jgi:UDPglucose--hexose-1-phosphate uridylyltransferase
MAAIDAAGQVWKSTGRLADGREIIYFDESPGLGRADIRDTRDLSARPAELASYLRTGTGPAAAADAGLRWDPLVGEWVVIAAQRQDRTFQPSARDCPLCPSRPGHPTEIPAPDYDVVVFENRFPALRPPAGRCEVVCFTSDHDASFASLTPRRVRTVLAAWADRTRVLGEMDGVEQVYPFENRGEEIGVTLHHPHGQVYAFPFVTPRTGKMLAQARAWRAAHSTNLFDDLVGRELSEGSRTITRNEHWFAFVPFAARWPFEVLLFPAERVADLAALGSDAGEAFGEIYLDILGRLDALFGIPMPYIAAWHQAPARDAFARAEFGLHLQVFGIRRAAGRLKYLAGTESGMGVWLNDVVPEAAARMLREAG